MKHIALNFLKFVLIVVALLLMIIGIFGVPSFIRSMRINGVDFGIWRLIFGITIYPAILLFLMALYQAFRLLGYIRWQKTFTQMAVVTLNHIKKETMTVTGLLYVAFLPVAYMIADDGDAPGLIIFAFLFASAPLVIGIFAYVMEMLLKEAIAIKTENELTV
ncbi:DUF2975 domain-containing protein [Agrilactobacillus yilanensis]|uniref:DUF2975 domain-containing protein n=1 Tax=Agrilactobacillus yilanensis TaxID=2485997 RepID=A0ABW4J410_9LACO|nr:DUF2975 domain-containing protein [Agrilactobacillus yilanensis]